MPNLDRLAGLALALTRTMAGNLVYRRLLSLIVLVVVLTVITGMLGGALIIGSALAGYFALVQHGISNGAALAICVGFLIVAGMICILAAKMLVNKMRHALLPVPSVPRMRHLIDAFIDGWMEEKHKD